MTEQAYIAIISEMRFSIYNVYDDYESVRSQLIWDNNYG